MGEKCELLGESLIRHTGDAHQVAHDASTAIVIPNRKHTLKRHVYTFKVAPALATLVNAADEPTQRRQALRGAGPLCLSLHQRPASESHNRLLRLSSAS